MSYIKKIRSDSTATTIYNDDLDNATAVFTAAISVSDYKDIDFIFTVADKETATQIIVDEVQFSNVASPIDSQWAPYFSELIEEGTATQSIYSPTFSLASYAGATPFSIPLSLPTKGLTMRLKFHIDSGTLGIVAVTALRRA